MKSASVTGIAITGEGRILGIQEVGGVKIKVQWGEIVGTGVGRQAHTGI